MFLAMQPANGGGGADTDDDSFASTAPAAERATLTAEEAAPGNGAADGAADDMRLAPSSTERTAGASEFALFSSPLLLVAALGSAFCRRGRRRRSPHTGRTKGVPEALLPILTVASLWPVPAAGQSAQIIEYYHTDTLGSVRAVTKVVSGQVQVVSRHDFMPFGEEVNAPNPPMETRLFTGKERDGETGLHYFGARFQAATLGRFVSVDPLTASQSKSDPQTFNRYSYALNNPLRFTDPDGLQVPKSCVTDPTCVIVVKMRVIVDSGMNDGTGITQKQKDEFVQYQLNRLKHDTGASNVKLEVAWTTGVIRGLNNIVATDTVDNSGLNVYISNRAMDNISAGLTRRSPQGDVISVGVDLMKRANPNTLTHEFAHTFNDVEAGRASRVLQCRDDRVIQRGPCRLQQLVGFRRPFQ